MVGKKLLDRRSSRFLIEPERGVTFARMASALVGALIPLGFEQWLTKKALFLSKQLDVHQRLNLAFFDLQCGGDFKHYFDVHDRRQIELFKSLLGWKRPVNDVFAYAHWNRIDSKAMRAANVHVTAHVRKRGDVEFVSESIERLVRQTILPKTQSVTLQGLVPGGRLHDKWVEFSHGRGTLPDRHYYLLDLAGLLALEQHGEAQALISRGGQMLARGFSYDPMLKQLVSDATFVQFIERAKAMVGGNID